MHLTVPILIVSIFEETLILHRLLRLYGKVGLLFSDFFQKVIQGDERTRGPFGAIGVKDRHVSWRRILSLFLLIVHREILNDSAFLIRVDLMSLLLMVLADLFRPENDRIDATIAAPAVLLIAAVLHAPLTAPWHINLAAQDSID